MYIVVGGSGFLGSYIIKKLLSAKTEKIIAVSRRGLCAFDDPCVETLALDVCDFDGVKRLAQRVDVAKTKIFYLAASHNVDFVESNPDEAAKTNIAALKNFLECFSGFERFLFSSSDTVYGEGGDEKPFAENDLLCPINVYGQQKAEGEKLVVEAGGTVLRYSLMFGGSLSTYSHNFCDELKRMFRNGKSAEMYTDFVRSALDYDTAAQLTVALAEFPGRLPGTLNLCGDEVLSKYDLAVKLAESIGADRSLVIAAKGAGGFKAPRAEFIAMDNTLVKNLLGLEKIFTDSKKM